MRTLLLVFTFGLLPFIGLGQFALNGSATKVSDSIYQLTPAQTGTVGSIWDSTRLDVSKSFDISFNLRFGCNNGGADGIAFVLQRDIDGLSALAKNVNRMGYQTAIGNSVAFEFDTENDGTNDIGPDHVAIHKNGAQNSVLAGPESMYLDARNVEDCGLHRVRITYNSANNAVVVYVDCQQRISTKIDLKNDIFNGANNVWMGFTASNGSTNTPHLVQWIGNTRPLTFGLDVAAVCPDSIQLKSADLNRNEFTNPKWEIVYKGNTISTINKYKSVYKAPQLGNYEIKLSVLRVCDSVNLNRQTTVKAIDETDVSLSYEIDTFCDNFKLRVNTSCLTCNDLQWDFGSQAAAWGFPNQILNFTRSTHTNATFIAESRNGSCFAKDSLQFDLKVLNKYAPSIAFNNDTICGGDRLLISVDPSIGDSVGFEFTPGFGLNPVGKAGLDTISLAPTGFGTLGVYRSVHYPKYSCIFNDTHFVQVDTFPVADFLVLDSSKNCNKVVYNFQNKSLYASNYKWLTTYDTVRVQDLSTLVTFPRQFSVRLVTVNGACRDTALWKTLPDLYYAPVSSLSSDSTEGCSPFETTFNWKSEPLDSYFIDFGNGVDSFGTKRNETIKMDYTSGFYDVKWITYSGNGNCIDTTILSEYIIVRDSVEAGLGIADFGGCPPFRLDISDSSFFGDADIQNKYVSVSTSDNLNFRQVYFLNDEDTTLENEGIYNVVYYVSNGYCTDTVFEQVEVKGLTKKDTVELYGVTIDDNLNANYSWKPEAVASYYDVSRVDDAGSERIFAQIIDTALIDHSINATRTEYKYTVTAVDDCGSRSAESQISTTILLTGEVNEEQIAQLSWTEYEYYPGGVRNYVIEPINGTKVNTNGTQFFDDEFFDLSKPDTGRCYRVYAYENGGDSFISASNILCLSPQTQVYFPSAFSPNNDGDNDTFKWKGVGVRSTNLRIYNRWGQRVFDGENEWDGTFNNTICQDGLYYYVATMVGSNNDTYFYKGEIYLRQ
ncbi:MAG: lectin-like domain-containing protein [Bacteroidia bacterium]